MRRRRKGLRASWKEYLAERKRARKEREKHRQRRSYIRKKIRKTRMRRLRFLFLKFLKNPFNRNSISREEKILREHVKTDIWEYRKHLIRDFPSMLSKRINKIRKERRERFEFFKENFYYSINPLVGRGSKDLRRDMLLMALNSTIIYTLAFWVMYFAGQMVTILTARFYSIPAVLYSYITDWPLFVYSPLYTRKNLILIFGAGPLAGLILSVIIYRIFLVSYKHKRKIKLFLIWLVFHGINMFFGAYIAGVITRTGLIYTSAWIFLSNPYDVEEIVLLILSVVILVVLGFTLTRLFIRSSYSERIVQPRVRLFYIFGVVFIPLLLGNLLIYLINFPEYPLNFMLLQGFSLLLGMPAFIYHNAPANIQMKLSLSQERVKVGWLTIILFVGLSIIIRIFIFPGIQF